MVNNIFLFAQVSVSVLPAYDARSSSRDGNAITHTNPGKSATVPADANPDPNNTAPLHVHGPLGIINVADISSVQIPVAVGGTHQGSDDTQTIKMAALLSGIAKSPDKPSPESATQKHILPQV